MTSDVIDWLRTLAHARPFLRLKPPTMRTHAKLTSLIALLLTLAAWQAQAASTAPTKTTTTTADESAAAFEKAGIAGLQHQRLAELVGAWKVTQSFWTAGNSTPRIDTGSATYAMVLGGRHLRQDLHINSPDKAFEALGYIGYDNMMGRYYSSWMDVNFTGLIIAYGDYDAASHIYTFLGTLPGPAASKTIPLRAELKIIDANHFTYDFYERHDGNEALAVRLEYTRRN